VSVSRLSSSAQDYLKALWSLGEWEADGVTVTALAERLGVRTSTASDGLKKLVAQGLAEHAPYGAISLTPDGRAHAVAMVRRHRLLETYLVEELGYRWDEVHDEAEVLEHAVSDTFIERIDARLGHPTRDPHGDPIPSPAGTVTRPDAVLLSNVPVGADVVVARISDADPAALREFAAMGLALDLALIVRSRDGETMVVAAPGGATLVLGTAQTGAIWVTRA